LVLLFSVPSSAQTLPPLELGMLHFMIIIVKYVFSLLLHITAT
jgi:hypothetical protein